MYIIPKAKAAELEAMIVLCGGAPDQAVAPRYAALAMTDLESSIMWAVKALTS